MGVTAPGANNIEAFRSMVFEGTTTLRLGTSLELGRRLFPVGDPDFDFQSYRDWIEAREGAVRFTQLESKMGTNSLFAIGATIQALESNPGLEQMVREADSDVHIHIGSGMGDLPEAYHAHETLSDALRMWSAFWAHPSRCPALCRYREGAGFPDEGGEPPVDPAGLEIDSDDRATALLAWNKYWAARSDSLTSFEERYRDIERRSAGEFKSDGGLSALKQRRRLHRRLQEEYGSPTPPWDAVDPRLLWSLQNVPSAQVSMLLKTHGPAWSPSGACATFGLALKLGVDAIKHGDARIAIIGSTDPRPEPVLISAFHQAGVVLGLGDVSFPLTAMHGTHLSGGACVWIIADRDYMAERGIKPVGPSIEGIGVASDAQHIIKPATDGPQRAIDKALTQAGVDAPCIGAWDLHATGTVGDVTEAMAVPALSRHDVAVSARKGIFGHGMANSAGWELTALALGLNDGLAPPTSIPLEAIHPDIQKRFGSAIVTGSRPISGTVAAKLMLGIGGIACCVVLRS